MRIIVLLISVVIVCCGCPEAAKEPPAKPYVPPAYVEPDYKVDQNFLRMDDGSYCMHTCAWGKGPNLLLMTIVYEGGAKRDNILGTNVYVVPTINEKVKKRFWTLAEKAIAKEKQMQSRDTIYTQGYGPK